MRLILCAEHAESGLPESCGLMSHGKHKHRRRLPAAPDRRPEPMSDSESQAAPARRRDIPLMSITAIALSLLALVVSIFEVAAVRREQRIQAWPFIEVATVYNADGFTLRATNKGIGPARIRGLEFQLDEQPMESLDALIAAAVEPQDVFSYELYRSSNPRRSVMSPDKSVDLFAVPWEPRTRKFQQSISKRLDIRICYCSVYDECWLARLNGGDPDAVNRCASTGP